MIRNLTLLLLILFHPATAETPEADLSEPRVEVRVELLEEVEREWKRPVLADREPREARRAADITLREKMRAIEVPRVSYSGAPLSRVVESLSLLSEELDVDGQGVNLVVVDPSRRDPEVHLTLRRLSLDRILDFVTESVGFEYDIQSDAVVLRPARGALDARLETDFFPLSRSTLIRLTGRTEDEMVESLAAPEATTPTDDRSPIEVALQNFLERAGIPFGSVSGSSLALADGQLIVTQTARNLEKVRNLLRRYAEVKQVEIEAKFLEVQQGDLEELGLQWTFTGGDGVAGTTGVTPTGTNTLRSLDSAFGESTASSTGRIVTPSSSPSSFTFDVSAPSFPKGLNLAAGVGNVANIVGVLGEADVNVILRALAQREGSDLLSAPRVTVLSGKTAEITVAQELRYPRAYSDIDSAVSTGSLDSGAGVSITAGTPRDFEVRNIGVEMRVTPTVEDDNSISLVLEPTVTEFDGFVEYGGPSVAVSGTTTVNVPSGFFQPIFSVRKISTEVTIWNGATVVMGGLTREEVVEYEDRVPVLGSIPLFGRLFRSSGASSQKRNLIIFVQANLVNPGGAPLRSGEEAVPPGSLYREPYLSTPQGQIPPDDPS